MYCGLLQWSLLSSLPMGFQGFRSIVCVAQPCFLLLCLSDLFAPPGAFLSFCRVVDERNVDFVSVGVSRFLLLNC